MIRYIYDGISLQNGRDSNMDSLLLKERTIGGIRAMLAVVCDGVGSKKDGAFAASAAVRMLSEWFGWISDLNCIGLQLRDAVLKINGNIMETARLRGLDTASTLSALLLIENTYIIVHIGDSRIYSYQGNQLTQMTSDDVSTTGKLTACLGYTKEPALFYDEGCADGKLFLLCSDGLYKRTDFTLVKIEAKTDLRKNLKKIMETLVQYAIQCGERDNISLAVLKIEN